MDGHFRAAYQAIQMAVPLAGYFVWSLFNNFEWGFGNTQRIGLVRSDYEPLERTIKDSGYWNQQVIRQNGIS